MSAITRSRSNRRSRKLSGEQRPTQIQVPIKILSITSDGDNLTLVFNQTVKLTGIPQFRKNGTIAPTGATMTAPNTVVLSYPSAGPEPATMSVPSDDPAIRNAVGGFVASNSITV